VTFPQGIVAIPMTLFCLQSLFYSTFPYLLNGGLWSLSVEIIVYCLFPFVQTAFNAFKQHYKIIMLVSYIATIYPSIVQSYFGGTSDIYVNPIFRFPEFIFGMCLSYAHAFHKKKDQSGKYAVLSLISLIIVIGILSKNRFINHMHFANNYCYYNCVTIPLLGIAIYSLATTNNKIILKITNNFVSNYLGKISYAFYMTQFIAIGVIGKRYFTNQGWKSLIMPLIINIAFAILMYESIEKRFRIKIINKFIKE
jgi:peptidoglycan/LPS O-acetylase OafA/YrhL